MERTNFSCEVAVGQPDVLVDESEPFLFYFSILCFFMSFIYFPGCYFYFLWHRRSHERLWRRNLFLITLHILGLMILSMNYSARNVWGARNYPCFVYYNVSALALVLAVFVPTARLFGLYFRIIFNRLLLHKVFDVLRSGDLLFKPGQETFRSRLNNETFAELSVPVSLDGISAIPGKETGMIEADHIPQDNQNNQRFLLSNVLFYIFCWKKHVDLEESVQLSYFLASSRFINGTLVLVSVLFLGFTTTSYFLQFPIGTLCRGCTPQSVAETTISIFVLVALMILIVLYLLRKHSDGLGVKYELTVCGITFVVLNTIFILPATFIFNKVEENGQWDWGMIVVIELFIIAWYISVYQVKLTQKQDLSGLVLDETIENILDTEEGTKAFALYLAVHLSVENLFFYKAIDKWKSDYSKNSVLENRKKAKNIIELYIGNDSVFEINLSYLVRENILQAIQNEGEIPIFIFDAAQKKVLSLISSGVFYRFLQSKYYSMFKNQVDLRDAI